MAHRLNEPADSLPGWLQRLEEIARAAYHYCRRGGRDCNYQGSRGALKHGIDAVRGGQKNKSIAVNFVLMEFCQDFLKHISTATSSGS